MATKKQPPQPERRQMTFEDYIASRLQLRENELLQTPPGDLRVIALHGMIMELRFIASNAKAA